MALWFIIGFGVLLGIILPSVRRSQHSPISYKGRFASLPYFRFGLVKIYGMRVPEFVYFFERRDAKFNLGSQLSVIANKLFYHVNRYLFQVYFGI